MRVSIIINTYNNANKLSACLEHLEQQNFQEVFEVIVVDDGSTDNTAELLRKWKAQKTKFIFSSLYQENKKQAAARNLGVKHAKGDLILFIGADILLCSDALFYHYQFHKRFSAEKHMAVGHITWPPHLENDAFCNFLEKFGYMPNFDKYNNLQETDFWHFYTGNISLKRRLAEKHPFSEDFCSYGFEDAALGCKLISGGAKLLYLKDALAFHDHALTPEDYFPKKMRDIGKSAVVFQNQHPEIQLLPTGVKKHIFSFLSSSLVIRGLQMLKQEWAWYAISKKYYLEGVDGAEEM